jgi:hypothetical protein
MKPVDDWKDHTFSTWLDLELIMDVSQQGGFFAEFKINLTTKIQRCG